MCALYIHVSSVSVRDGVIMGGAYKRHELYHKCKLTFCCSTRLGTKQWCRPSLPFSYVLLIGGGLQVSLSQGDSGIPVQQLRVLGKPLALHGCLTELRVAPADAQSCTRNSSRRKHQRWMPWKCLYGDFFQEAFWVEILRKYFSCIKCSAYCYSPHGLWELLFSIQELFMSGSMTVFLSPPMSFHIFSHLLTSWLIF